MVSFYQEEAKVFALTSNNEIPIKKRNVACQVIQSKSSNHNNNNNNNFFIIINKRNEECGKFGKITNYSNRVWEMMWRLL